MIIWVDADACPVDIRSIITMAALRCSVKAILVANCYLRIDESEFLEFVQVKSGADVADDYIVEHCNAGDLVITADIPLAARIVEKGASGIDPRGEEFTEENVQQRLSMRNFMEEMRMNGMVEGGPSEHSAADTRNFANALDRTLTRYLKNANNRS